MVLLFLRSCLFEPSRRIRGRRRKGAMALAAALEMAELTR